MSWYWRWRPTNTRLGLNKLWNVLYALKQLLPRSYVRAYRRTLFNFIMHFFPVMDRTDYSNPSLVSIIFGKGFNIRYFVFGYIFCEWLHSNGLVLLCNRLQNFCFFFLSFMFICIHLFCFLHLPLSRQFVYSVETLNDVSSSRKVKK